jgi:hypothetical protein
VFITGASGVREICDSSRQRYVGECRSFGQRKKRLIAFFCARIIGLAPSKARTRVADSPRMTIENWELSIGQISFDRARVRWTPNFGTPCANG